jgi:hypothetical protein
LGARYTDIAEIIREFAISGRIAEVKPIESGHINETYVSTFSDGRRYIHQKINRAVFKDPSIVMENVARVIGHIRGKSQADTGDTRESALSLIPTGSGAHAFFDRNGVCWRTFNFLEGMTTYDSTADPRIARIVGSAYGKFQRMMSDLPSPRLHVTIPGFHDTPSRFESFRRAVSADRAARSASVEREIGFALERGGAASRLATLLASREMPERVVHNDTKINNVMINSETGRSCVIDLDTVMPGLAVIDFGDAVRTGASKCAEDEADASKAGIDLAVFRELSAGYLDEARSFLTSIEIENLVFACWVIALEQGVRFLEDYLNGDRYYRTRRPGQNLDRCRVQLALVEDIERNREEMEQAIKSVIDDA